jgi:hypothetical protein
MIEFFIGLSVGIVYRKKIINTILNFISKGLDIYRMLEKKIIKLEEDKLNNSITKVIFLCKVKNDNFFQEFFMNDNKIIMNPYWNYSKESNVIKIELDTEFLDTINTIVKDKNIGTDVISFRDLIDLKSNENKYVTTLDLPFFKSLGEVFLYFYYITDFKKFINIYGESDILSLDDFNIHENTIMKDVFNKIKFATLKTSKITNEYCTDYLKMFLNSKINLTPEMLFYNYDKKKINTDDNMTISCIVDNSFINFKANEYMVKKDL